MTAPLMTSVAVPRDRAVTGSMSRMNTGQMSQLSSPMTAPPRRAALQLSTCTPGSTDPSTPNVNDVASQPTMIRTNRRETVRRFDRKSARAAGMHRMCHPLFEPDSAVSP